MDNVRENLFTLVLKIFVRLLWIKQVKASRKSLSGAIYNEKNGEMEAKRVLDNLRMSKLREIFTTVVIMCHRYKRLAVLQNVFAKDLKKLFELRNCM